MSQFNKSRKDTHSQFKDQGDKKKMFLNQSDSHSSSSSFSSSSNSEEDNNGEATNIKFSIPSSNPKPKGQVQFSGIHINVQSPEKTRGFDQSPLAMRTTSNPVQSMRGGGSQRNLMDNINVLKLGPKSKSVKRKESEDSDDSLIRLFSLNLKDNLQDEEEDINDLDAVVKNISEEELQTELPRKIFNALRTVAERISQLDKDEFGDYVYREKDNADLPSQRLKKSAEGLKFWLNKLK